MGLRALYFAVAGFMQMFHFLHYGFASIIIIIILGIKMLLSEVYKIPIGISLALIVVIMLVCIIVSLLRPRRADLKMLFQRTEKLGLSFRTTRPRVCVVAGTVPGIFQFRRCRADDTMSAANPER